ncbi:agmatine deiminase [Ferrimonas sp. YFM]|uniref:agmatine deiminase n=1 Tax=Ferrimonas sp. YFM TaxID=3028878 RepID=UPI0025741AF3|nr:agmatine deiminase [Ferrimonas sp. YFM]BDY05276.1 putative agmatine deiminase [Ferrimonas sp. YFM]
MPFEIQSTPKKDGFRLAAEWERQKQLWMIWPEHANNWHSGAKPAQRVWVDICKTVAKYQPVTVIASGDQYKTARYMLPEEVRVVEMSINDSWCRDSAPSFVINDETGEVRGVDWLYNAYGGLEDGHYFPWDKTAQVAEKICEVEWLDLYKAPITVEGGAIHTDGQGTLMTTEAVLCNRNRNPQFTKEQVEEHLKEYCGVDKVIWLPEGLATDCTGGHIDDLACWVEPGKVLLQWTDDEKSENYDIVRTAYDILSTETDAQGRKLQVVKMLAPKNPILITPEEAENYDLADYNLEIDGGFEQVGSYINFLIGNGLILIPSYDDPNDDLAVETLKGCFPGREVVKLPNAREIAIGGGIVHCITHEQPAGAK